MLHSSSTKKVWRKVFGDNFQRGDYVKFKWGDTRRAKRKGHQMIVGAGVTKWIERKTWCYGTVSQILSDGEYIVKLIKGSPFHGSLHAQEVKEWKPRRK